MKRAAVAVVVDNLLKGHAELWNLFGEKWRQGLAEHDQNVVHHILDLCFLI